MKKISIILFFLGLSLIIEGAAWIGAKSIIESVISVGLSGLIILTLWQLFIIFTLTIAWYSVCPNLGFIRLGLARTLREAAATCLPFSQIGGIILGIRAVYFRGFHSTKNKHVPSIVDSISANIVDITTEIIGQILFIIVGIIILLTNGYHNNLHNIHLLGYDINFTWFIILGSVLLSTCIIPLIWTQRQGSAFFRKIIDFLSKNIAQQWSGQLTSGTDSLKQSLDQIWSNPRRVAMSCFIHFIGWMGGAVGTWICYRFLGAQINIFEAIAIEAIVCVALSLGFLVPASIGIQEGAYVVLGTIFGIDPHLSFGLSILRRARDVLIGIPSLLLWQIAEIRYLRKHPKEKKTLDLPLN